MKKLWSLLAIGSLLTGCGINPSLTPSRTDTTFGAKRLLPKGAKKWTILVHLAADNNLHLCGLEDIKEMEGGINPDDVNVVVLFDGGFEGDSGVYEIIHNPNGKSEDIISPLNQDLPFIGPEHEINSGDVNVVKAFGEWAIKKYPAEHYATVFWDHGSGIFRKGAYQSASVVSTGFCSDDNGTKMRTKDLSTLIPAFAKAAGKPIDIVGFDACLMGHVEIAYQMKGYADHLVGSEELEPGSGWDYMGWLKHVNGNASAPAVASSLVQAYGQSYRPGGSQDFADTEQDCTLSAIDINALTSKFVPALNRFAQVMTDALPAARAELTAARSNSLCFYNKDCTDIGDFVRKLQSRNVPSSVKQAASDVQTALGSTVISETHTGKPQNKGIASATGLMIYFPNAMQNYNPLYDQPGALAFAAEGWKDFLHEFRKQSEPTAGVPSGARGRS